MNKELFLVDLFSGCGGFNEGFKKAGFKTIVSNDIWEPAYKTFFKNPHGAVNGAWDYSTYFVGRNQIPTSCSANQLGYTFLTSFDVPRAYFKIATCYELNKAPLINDVDRYP